VDWRWIRNRLKIIGGRLKVNWRGTGGGSEVDRRWSRGGELHNS
jgi:hypothetical protein